MRKWSFKMGGAVIGLGVLQLGMAYMEGEAAKDAADATAENIRLAAEADVLKINAELDDALSTQQVLFGGQGRLVEGSATAVMQGDKEAAARDIKAVREGATRTASATRAAGRTARFSARAGGVMSAAQTGLQYKQIG